MTFSKYFSAFTLLGALTLSLPARADVPPNDQCSAVGSSCYNAIVDGSLPIRPGVCKQAMCTRATPDGPMTYECYRCVAEDGGMGGQPNEGGSAGTGATDTGGSAAAGAPSNPSGGTSAGGASAGGTSAGGSASSAGAKSGSKSSSDDGGCSVSVARGGAGSLGAVLVALGFAVAGIRRRRSLPS